ncbi:MAG: MurR/RpiR family transcriptional regulator [Stappiaceae bacterium]
MRHTFDLMKRLSTLAMSGEGALQPLANWVISNRNRIPNLPLASLAKEAGVSETTVFRLARRVGFSGYRDMRMSLAELRGIATGQFISEEEPGSGREDPYSVIAKNTVNVHTSILRATVDLVDPAELERAIKALQNSAVIQIIGFGSSAAPAMDVYQRLVRFGLIACVYSDPHILTAVTSNTPKGSLFFAISFSGQSKDVVDALNSACEQGLNSILITSNPESAACEYADIVLHSAPSGALVGSETVATRVSQLAIIDMICTGLALEHPRKNEFLRNANVIEEEIEKKRVHAPTHDPADDATILRNQNGN